jgi:hypothetical protein
MSSGIALEAQEKKETNSGPVVDVLLQHPALACRPASGANEPHRVNIEQEGSGATLR